ncbi:oligopeptide transporter subunit; ATP-binding component of ABC superfamily [Mesorhizobium plurifarium]|uniref:Oligopeptide transporter subunit ATP-binding component of ABC superfamily n=1 Tax=Mesorhizobium plurifarium TaxID=69974 RepID=A0A0K2VQN8_MESPL|nr:oligopeptide transporter subunit; ATP-binding component of ABC superfamily [Mesorhizobium plurifarium]
MPNRSGGLPYTSASLRRDRAGSFRSLPFPCEACMSAVLTIDSLYKRFPIAGSKQVVQAINGVSLTIKPGETLGLVGESGSGKTTVGRCIVGLVEPTAGTIRFRDMDLAQRRQHKSKLGGKIQFVFQEPNESLDPRMKIGDTISEPLLPLKFDRETRRRRTADALRLVRLHPDLLDAYPSELSSGQQQRVGVARAMVTEPELVILDEPTSALDPTARAEIIDLLQRIQRERNTAYLFISHDLSTVRFISHRVAVMYLGMIVEQGSAETVFNRPQHPYSSGLLSSVMLPHPHLKIESSVTLKGEIPSPIDLPKGCFLASRCPFVIDRCRHEMPPAETVGERHTVHCFRHDDVAASVPASDTFNVFMNEAERILGRAKANAPAASSQ